MQEQINGGKKEVPPALADSQLVRTRLQVKNSWAVYQCVAVWTSIKRMESRSNADPASFSGRTRSTSLASGELGADMSGLCELPRFSSKHGCLKGT